MNIKIEVTESGRKAAKCVERLYLLDREEGMNAIEKLCTATRLWSGHVYAHKDVE